MSTLALRLRRYGKTASLAATSATGDSPLFLVDYLLRLLRVVVLIALWRVILRHTGGASGMSLATILTYTLVAEVFYEQLDPRTQLQESIWQGTITMYLLQPMTTIETFAADMAGRWAFGILLFSLPLLACASLLGVDPRPAGLAAGAVFAVSMVLAISVGLALDFLFAALAVALEQGIWIVSQVRVALTVALSGALVPLALLPWGLGGIFGWLPFASMVSTPLRIYTGTATVLPLLVVQAGWSAVLWPLSWWLWRANREKLVGYGG
ncbi:MAG: hypothetical protein NVSMB65_17880 [Chloroflexota bacterium]